MGFSPNFTQIVAAVFIGLDKGGIPGLGALGMAFVLSNTGSQDHLHLLAIYAPILMLSDIGAIFAYRKDIDFSIMFRMGLPILVGMVAAFLFIGNGDVGIVRIITGIGLVFLSFLHFCSKLFQSPHILPCSQIDHDKKVNIISTFNHWKIGTDSCIGLLTGILTVVANVAGPIIAIYLLNLNLPKRRLNGTRGLLFLAVNFVKIPSQILLGNFSVSDLYLVVPLSVIGIASTLLTESYLMKYIDQSNFETVTWVLVAIGGMKLIFR